VRRQTLVIAVVALAGFAHCPAAWPQDGKTQDAPPSQSARSSVIYTGTDMSYANPKAIDPAIFMECFLPQYGGDHLVIALRNAGLDIVRDNDAVKAGKGRVFEVKIVNTFSFGNSVVGAYKGVDVTGRLAEDGKEIGDFTGKRAALSGALGFKGTCAALKRSLDVLAGDIAQWLKNPGKNSRIGD